MTSKYTYFQHVLCKGRGTCATLSFFTLKHPGYQGKGACISF